MNKRISLGSVWVVTAVIMLCAAWQVFGTALSDERDTPARTGESIVLTVASNVIIYAGSMVCVDSSGLANPAADTSGFAVIGRADATADNRGTSYSATKTIKISRGVFQWANAGSIADADIGKIVYVTDDQTVNKTGGGQNIIAGAVVDLDSSGVWVDTGKIGPIGAATPSSLAVTGNGSIGGTLVVSGNGTFNGTTTTFTNNAAVTKNATVGGTLTVTGTSAASGFKIGATSGFTGSITNNLSGYTNVAWYSGGILTNLVYTGTP